MNILYVTAGQNGLHGLRYLLQAGIKVAAVLTISDKVREAARVSGFADVSDYCAAQDIPVITLDNYTITPQCLGGHDFDLLVVNGWNRLIGRDVLALFPLGGLGIHAGHPPIGLGRAPLPWNIIKGFKDIEVYVFRLTPRPDDGDICALRTIEITAQDCAQTLYEKVMFWGARLFVKVIQELSDGRLEPTRQKSEFSEHYPKRNPDDGAIDFSRSVDEVFNFIRAQSAPFPGAFAFLDGRKCQVWKASPFDGYAFREIGREPGMIVAALPSGLVVLTGSACIWLQSVTLESGERIAPGPLEYMGTLVGKRFLKSL
jgi:methionyl-tRNA formyltransferase